MFITFHAGLSLKVEPSESKTAISKTEFYMKIATQGHSRSFILQSVTGRQVAYRHRILLAPKFSEEVAIKIAENCRR